MIMGWSAKNLMSGFKPATAGQNSSINNLAMTIPQPSNRTLKRAWLDWHPAQPTHPPWRPQTNEERLAAWKRKKEKRNG